MKLKKCFIVLSLIMITIMACKHPPIARTFLIPSEYQGTLRIVYSEKCGIQPRVENEREVFEFPKNGLIILTTDNDYRINNDFYLVDEKGKRTKVNQIPTFEDRVNKMPAILYSGEVVSSSIVNALSSKSTQVSGGADCIDFYLYNHDTTKIEDSQLSQKLDRLTNSVVNACRLNQ